MAKAIIFDVGGVLLDYRRDEMLDAIAQACRAETTPSDIAELIGTLDLSLGERTMLDFHAGLQTRYDCSSPLEELCTVWVDGLQRRSWVLPMLEQLYGRADLYVLSDTNAEHWQFIEANILPIHLFMKIFLSFELLMTKKSRKIFDHILAEISRDSHECLFIDDTEANVVIANEVGFLTHHYRSRTELDQAIDEFLR